MCLLQRKVGFAYCRRSGSRAPCLLRVMVEFHIVKLWGVQTHSTGTALQFRTDSVHYFCVSLTVYFFLPDQQILAPWVRVSKFPPKPSPKFSAQLLKSLSLILNETRKHGHFEDLTVQQLQIFSHRWRKWNQHPILKKTLQQLSGRYHTKRLDFKHLSLKSLWIMRLTEVLSSLKICLVDRPVWDLSFWLPLWTRSSTAAMLSASKRPYGWPLPEVRSIELSQLS